MSICHVWENSGVIPPPTFNQENKQYDVHRMEKSPWKIPGTWLELGFWLSWLHLNVKKSKLPCNETSSNSKSEQYTKRNTRNPNPNHVRVMYILVLDGFAFRLSFSDSGICYAQLLHNSSASFGICLTMFNVSHSAIFGSLAGTSLTSDFVLDRWRMEHCHTQMWCNKIPYLSVCKKWRDLNT